VDERDPDGWTPLLWAAAHGDRRTLDVLIGAGADLRDATPRRRQDALILAAQWNRAEVVRDLLRRGADPARRDSIGWSALHWAALKGRTDVVRVLLDGGASVSSRDPAGNTALLLAARQGRTETVELLLARGASRGARDGDGRTAADLAAAAGYKDLAAELGGR
jgi:ankyrin repeat protein